jgi:hypothetical protein
VDKTAILSVKHFYGQAMIGCGWAPMAQVWAELPQWDADDGRTMNHVMNVILERRKAASEVAALKAENARLLAENNAFRLKFKQQHNGVLRMS